MTIVIEVVHIELDVFQSQKASLESQSNIVATSLQQCVFQQHGQAKFYFTFGHVPMFVWSM